MFRIYLHSTNGSEWLSLEGALAGQCVDDLERCWLALARSPHRGKTLLLDMSRLQSADQNGRKLLRRMRNRGVTLSGLASNDHTTALLSRRQRLVDSCLRWFRRSDDRQENILSYRDLL
jgi:hypothetical protein